MNTEELENKLKISRNTGVHCPTIELAKQVLNIFNDLGVKWCSDVSYIKRTNWDSYKENTIYYPFGGRFSYLKDAQQYDYKIISAEEFIALHTEEKEFDLENYEPRGELTGFPKEIIARMLQYQEEQGYPRDVSVFEKRIYAGRFYSGFDWGSTKEGCSFWSQVISLRNFNLFFERYPKQEHQDNQEFNLENYAPKGQLEGFPKEVIAKMLDYQEKQGNKRDVSIFENNRCASICYNGFYWDETKEEDNFWYEVIKNKNFDVFFKKYPKEETKTCSKRHKKENKMIKEELKNYEPKEELIGFPKEVIKRILDCQEEQSNKRDVSVFEKNKEATMYNGGFDWNLSKEGQYFWLEVINHKNFDVFFEKYPKQDNSQEFKVGDKVYDIISGRRGKVTYIETPNKASYPISVDFNDGKEASFTLDGRYYSFDKYSRLLHYRDDYNYDIIDFNNLPKRQEPKRWRAEKGEIYYFIKRDDYDNRLDRVCRNKDNYFCISNEQYKIGNYFQTKEEAQEVADKLKEYFKQLIKEEYE